MPQDANEQKYATEHAFLQYSDGCALFPCSELYKMTTDNLDPHYYNNSHIYFIGQHSNVRFLASKKVPLDSFEITYEIDAENNSQKRAGVSKFINCQNVLEITTIDNGKTCQIITNDRKNPRIVPFLQLLLFLETPPLEFLNVKVLYIGQAFGDGKGKKHRTAIERLKAHSTLQEILIKESEKKWLNTCLLFFTYTKPYRFILKMDGRGKPIIAGDEDLDHSKSVRENPPTTKQRIL